MFLNYDCLVGIILILISLLMVIVVTVFNGFLGCFLGACLATTPIMLGISTAIGFLTWLFITRKGMFAEKSKYTVSLIIIYPIISLVLYIPALLIGTSYQNDQAEKQERDHDRRVEQGIPDIGTISKTDNKYIYECKTCKFRVSFPISWKYETDTVFYNVTNDTKDPYLILYLNPQPGSYKIVSMTAKEVDGPAELNIDSLGGKPLGYSVENIQINNINYRISKKLGMAAQQISDNYSGIYAFAQYKDRKIIISTPSNYPNEPTGQNIEDFMALLQNIHFTD